MTKLLRVNVGCGATPTPGYVNFDNSLTVRLARWPAATAALHRLHILRDEQIAFARRARADGIRWANALRLPLADESCEVVYTSHMFEHLPREAAARFLSEARRVLAKGGWIRIVVPDLEGMVTRYVHDRDADQLVESTLLSDPSERNLRGRVRQLVVGDRHHAWMYDARSLVSLLGRAGFVDASAVPPGTTRMPDPGQLELREREGESVFVEAVKG